MGLVREIIQTAVKYAEAQRIYGYSNPRSYRTCSGALDELKEKSIN
mgnify:CR=1 FL=1